MRETYIRTYAALVIVVVGLMTFQSVRGPFRPVAALATPVYSAIEGVHSLLAALGAAVSAMIAEERELASLRGEVRGLRLRQLDAEEVARENERLRFLLGFVESRPNFVAAARVIGKGPARWSRTYLIDKGLDDGVLKDMAVVTPDGLIGKVQLAEASYAVVLLIDDETFAAAVRIGATRAAAIYAGAGQGRGEVRYLPVEESAEEGDAIVTSGLDAVFPPGIPVASVVRVEQEGEAIFHRIGAEPFVDTNSTEEVVVLAR
jgi:rod shape-determining protein MreC